MRIRTIKPDFYFDDKIAELSFSTRLAFIGLWLHADREGRLVDNPTKLKAMLFPYDKIDMNKLLNDLTKKPFILRYSVNGTKCIQIVNWLRHQKVHHAEPLTVLPEYNGETTVEQPLSTGNDPQGRVGKEGVGMKHPLQDKILHLEFVYLSEKEYTLLCEHIGKGNTDSYIARLNDYIGAKGKKYNSHYHVISGWFRRDNPDERPSTKRQIT